MDSGKGKLVADRFYINPLEITPEYIFEKIKHGPPPHQTWLKEALYCIFEGREVPAPRGVGDADD